VDGGEVLFVCAFREYYDSSPDAGVMYENVSSALRKKYWLVSRVFF